MKDYMAITPDQVEQAAAALKQLRPTYLDLLDYYQQIFVAQEDSRTQLNIEPIKISAEILAVKKKDQFGGRGDSKSHRVRCSGPRCCFFQSFKSGRRLFQ